MYLKQKEIMTLDRKESYEALQHATHTDTDRHTHMYIYIYMCVCVCDLQ